MRACTKALLEELASKLHEHHRNVNIAHFSGRAAAIVGGILVIAGIIAVPFTLGMGAILSVLGAVTGDAGAFVMVESNLVEIIEKLGLQEVQAAIEEDRNTCKKLQQQLDFLGDFISEMAMDLRSMYEYGVIDDGILLKELEGSGFQFLRRRIFEGIGSSTRFGTRFRIASVSMSASG